MYVIQGKIQLIESIFNVIYAKIKGGGAKGAGGGKGTLVEEREWAEERLRQEKAANQGCLLQ